MSDDGFSRRAILKGAGVAGVASITGLAGCANVDGQAAPGNATVRTDQGHDDDHGHDRCPPVEYVLNSGYDQVDENTLAPGADDDDWDVIGDEKNGPGSVPRDADVVGDSQWPAPYQDSQWISFEPDRGRTLPAEDTLYEYQYCFCLNEGFQEPELELAVQADDQVDDIRLNGISLPFSGDGNFQGPGIEETWSHRRYFEPGENCLTIVVRDTEQVISGLNVAGRMRAENADCDCGCAACDLAVEKTHADQFAFGETGTYEIEVCNVGDGECERAVVVEDELPDGVTFAGASGNGWQASASGGTITATHANPNGLDPGECLPVLTVDVEIAPITEFPTDSELLRNCADLLGSDETAANDTDCDEIRCLEGEYLVPGGVDDQFGGGNAEPTAPSEGLQERIQLPIREFDEAGTNAPFAHTFDVPQPPLAGEICEAELSFRARPDGANDTNDFISLGRWHDDGTKDDDYSWGQSMGDRATPGVFPVTWSANETGAHETTLDLSDLTNHDEPNTDLRPFLQQYGRLDVMIHDDTAVDYMHLEVTYCCGDEHCSLSIEKTAHGEFEFGDTGTYRIQVCNDGEESCDVGPLRVTDELPDGVSPVQIDGNGWTVTQNGQTVVAEHPNANGLAPGDCLPPIEIEVEIDPEDEWPHDRPVVRNCADLDVPEHDEVLTDCVTTEIGDGDPDPQPCELTLEKRTHGEFHYGDTGVYVLQVCNETETECPATVEVRDHLPDGMEPVDVTGQGWTTTVAGGGGTVIGKHAGGLGPGDCLPPLYIEVAIPPVDEYPGGSDAARNCAQVISDDQVVAEDCVEHPIFQEDR